MLFKFITLKEWRLLYDYDLILKSSSNLKPYFFFQIKIFILSKKGYKLWSNVFILIWHIIIKFNFVKTREIFVKRKVVQCELTFKIESTWLGKIRQVSYSLWECLCILYTKVHMRSRIGRCLVKLYAKLLPIRKLPMNPEANFALIYE